MGTGDARAGRCNVLLGAIVTQCGKILTDSEYAVAFDILTDITFVGEIIGGQYLGSDKKINQCKDIKKMRH